MELRQLTTFRLVATTLSFTRAARTLNYVQSNVTAQIQALEEELGVRLFDRLGRRVTLTDAGRRFLPYAERILGLTEEARAVVVGGEEPAGALTFSAPETLCTYRLPDVMRQFQERFPQVRLLMRPTSGVVSDLLRGVRMGELDVAIALEHPFTSASLVVEPLAVEPLLVLAHPQHALARAARVTPADIEGERLLLTEAGCGYRLQFDRELAQAGVHPAPALEFSSVEAIKQCVMVGMGVAVLPAVTVAAELAQGRLAALRWTGDAMRISTLMIWHKEKWLSPTLRAFLAFFRAALAASPAA